MESSESATVAHTDDSGTSRGGRARRRRLRGVVALVLGAVLVVGGIGVAALQHQSAQGSGVLAGFDPGDIIEDDVMFDGSTMTAGEIQTFLNEQQPTCAVGATCLKTVTADMPAMAANPMCGALAAKRGATAAQIIAAVGRACDVNPQVILVMLQKEQTLVTGRTPSSGETVALIYRKATGLGCPDTSACDPAKYGLFNQLYGVAYWLVRYTTPPGTTGTGWTRFDWFPVGKPSAVLYNPNAACGAKTITIRNKATAALYYYTPYQPNAAALAAGWGIGDSCSSYGNRNFFLYFTTWFGTDQYPVTGAIKTYWTAHRSTYGDPTAAATAVAGGTSQRFAKGTIYTSSAGTFGVTGATLTKYTAMGGPTGALGWPRKAQTNRTGAAAGTAQGFQHGTIYTSSAGAAAVLAPIYAKYMAAGYELGALGYPTGDAVSSTANGGGVQQTFQGGRIAAAGSSTAVVAGAALDMWQRRGAESGTLGWPTADATTVAAQGRTGTVQTFQSGVVVTQGTTRSVTGPIAQNYLFHGGPTGVLGWPSSVAHRSAANGGGWSQDFSGGVVYLGAATGVHALENGKVRSLYEQRGGVDGTLGWMERSGNDHAGIGGKYAVFQHGRIYSSSVGTDAVLGAILQRYLAKGGTKGVLGWPTSNAHSSGGATVQTFQHGRITWTPDGGAHASRS